MQVSQIRSVKERIPGGLILALTGSPLDDVSGLEIQRPAVGIDQAVNQIAAGTRHDLHDSVVSSGLPWIAPESHAGAILVDHLLDDNGHLAERRVQGQFLAVQQRRIGPEGGPHYADGVEHGIYAHHADDRLVQAGE